MFPLVLIVLLPVAAVTFRYRKALKDAFITVRYELLYWALGGIAVADDMIFSWKNQLKEQPQRRGEVAIVTGGARGIGREVVKKLLQCDMTVVIACRKVQAGEAAVQAIRALGISSGQTDVIQLDVASVKSVRAFADTIRSKYDAVHLLINNAGIMFVPFSLTKDGFESHQATNYIGHFLLSHLLMPNLIRAGRNSGQNSRIVNVSSCAHLPGSINFDDFNYQRSFYIASQVYAQSKLAQVMFSKAIERIFRQNEFPVSSFSVHPGIVNTELFDGTLLKTIAPWMPVLFFKRPEQGAVSILYAALSTTLNGQGGAYISNCRELWVSPAANNVEQQNRLMEMTQKMLKVKKFAQVD